MEDFRQIDIGSLMMMRQLKSIEQQDSVENSSFDPCQAMIKKNSVEQSVDSVPEYDVESLEELENFCAKHGILGVNLRTQDPKSTLRMLKRKMGIIEEKITEKKLLFD